MMSLKINNNKTTTTKKEVRFFPAGEDAS